MAMMVRNIIRLGNEVQNVGVEFNWSDKGAKETPRNVSARGKICSVKSNMSSQKNETWRLVSNNNRWCGGQY